MTSFLIDRGALPALIDAGDTHYPAAAAFVQVNATATFYLPDTVFAEAMVLIKARLGTKPAVELGERLMKSSHFEIIRLTAEDRRVTWEIFSHYTDKDWSYVDCSLLALACRLGVFEIIALDRHFDQMPELTRLPAR